ncbi:hypothetical protein ABEB36_007571 [Hypothenemus hampei]|uniref:S-adenosylmethionine sensor upstream of mTORC1 n=1 Tax=Hypothenemus hampei TaxID=57062 RepID=A0ABD1EUZ9_HYPHA
MNTCSQNHVQLSDYIKITHKKLREEAELIGFEEAWKKHCENRNNLKQYASAMQELAINHWEKNLSKNNKVVLRTDWIYRTCMEYFNNLLKYREKELNILLKNHQCFKAEEQEDLLIVPSQGLKYKVLDVGSCYNPFTEYEKFDVIAIDIAPANESVLICDFLNVNIDDTTVIDNKTIKQIAKNHFHIVVFSLLLEYLPSPLQRLKCCLNAYEVLKSEGLLAIISPDSKHVGSNSKIFKSWQYVLSNHGFIRIKYEKLPYLHCMLFRKVPNKFVAKRWAEMHEGQEFFKEIFIPQDFQQKKMSLSVEQRENTLNGWDEHTFLKYVDSNFFE